MADSLNEKIKHFYDRSTPLWLDTWGEHMHHGYYPEGEKTGKSHQQAQVDLAMQLLRWGKAENAQRILDAGCGVGGSARLLAQLFDAQVLGCTLSPVQAERAQQYNRQAGLEDKVEIVAQDMMSLSEADGPFDLIWSLESAEHIRDKQRLLDIFYELLEPGEKFLMATWCHRPLPPALSTSEKQLLERIYKLYHLPPMVSVEDLQQMAEKSGFQHIQTGDWSDRVAPFWKAVIRSAFRWKSVSGLLQAGWPTIQGAWAMRYMTAGYRRGLIKFGLIQGQKP